MTTAQHLPPNIPSTMIGVSPKGYDPHQPEAVAITDPSASIDPQTGATIPKKSAEERWFVARLDAILLIYTCVSQVLKYLDQQNITNAYVSGMKEDLNLQGVEYNLFTTYFNVGYAIFLIPSQIIITRVRPSYWLPALEFAWGTLTLFLYLVKDAKQVYAMRAFMGAFEASAYPGALMLLMSWYTPRELAFRIGIYHSCQSIGLMVSGALQSAIQATMHNANGLAGWRWMFIVDGLMTVVWAALGLILIPDFPTKPNPWAFWLKPRHVEIAKERTQRFRRADNKKFTLASIKRTFSQPLFYFFITLYPAAVLAQAGYQYFSLFLKSLKDANGNPLWTVTAVNAIPIGGSAITVVTVWVYSFLSDYFQTRWLIVLIQAVWGIIPCIILSVWNVPLGAKYFSYFATYLSLATAPPIFSWMSDLCPYDAEQRAFIVGAAITMYYAVGAWSNVLIWPANQVPHYHAAWQTSIALWVLVIILLCTLRYIEIKYIRPKNRRIAEEISQTMQQAEAEAGEQAKVDQVYGRESEEGKKPAGMVQRVVSA